MVAKVDFDVVYYCFGWWVAMVEALAAAVVETGPFGREDPLAWWIAAAED